MKLFGYEKIYSNAVNSFEDKLTKGMCPNSAKNLSHYRINQVKENWQTIFYKENRKHVKSNIKTRESIESSSA